MRVRMLIAVSGLRSENRWPPIGGEVDIPDAEARDLIAAGYAEQVSPSAAPQVERAVVSPPETRAPRRDRSRSR